MSTPAQIISIFAMGFNILSFQFKAPKKIMGCQMIGTMLFAVSMFMLNAITGGIMNILGMIRSIVYMNAERIPLSKKTLTTLFIATYFLSYASVFLFFGGDPTAKNLLVELLPVIAMTSITIGFARNDSKTIRRMGFINSPCWLAYGIFVRSIGSILCEVVGIGSIIVGTIRHDLKKKSVKEKNPEQA